MDLMKKERILIESVPFSSNLVPLTGKQLTYEPDAFISSLNYDSEDIMPSSIKSTGADSISAFVS